MTYALVPFAGITQIPASRIPAPPGRVQGVSITLHPDALEIIAEKMAGWFHDWDDVQIVDVGVSDNVGLGFVLLAWIACEIDPLFLAILRDEEAVGDYTVYGRRLEE